MYLNLVCKKHKLCTVTTTVEATKKLKAKEAYGAGEPTGHLLVLAVWMSMCTCEYVCHLYWSCRLIYIDLPKVQVRRPRCAFAFSEKFAYISGAQVNDSFLAFHIGHEANKQMTPTSRKILWCSILLGLDYKIEEKWTVYRGVRKKPAQYYAVLLHRYTTTSCSISSSPSFFY